MSLEIFFAKIAQLVEHNLAKVGVAGSNPVFRSKIEVYLGFYFFYPALVVELVDTQDLKSCVRKDVRVQVPSGVLADNQRFSSLFKRAFFVPRNHGYNIGTTNLGLRCTIKFHLGFKERFRVFPLLVVFCNNFSIPKRLTLRY